jgi:gamma-glutamyl-gamma-aminobutyrate hydrolase PuuD
VLLPNAYVEAIEKEGAECIIGVQFHPEAFTANGNDSLLPIFTHLIEAAGKMK